MSLAKDTRKLVRQVEQQGWRVAERRNGWMVFSPHNDVKVMIHRTPSDQRALRNTIAELRKGGFDPDA